MTHRITYILLSCALLVAVSCRKDVLVPEPARDGCRMVASKSPMTVKAAPENDIYEETGFAENTRYRLWAYDRDGAYMFDEDHADYGLAEKPNGVLSTETKGRYIQMERGNAKVLRDYFKAYGFTDCKAREGEVGAEEESSWLPADSGSNLDNPEYTITFNKELEAGYPDYCRAALEFGNGSTSSVMDFRHIFSRVRVQVIQQAKDDPDEGGDKVGRFDLTLHAVELTGMYDTQIYNVRDDRFRLPSDVALPHIRDLRTDQTGEPIIPAEAYRTPFAESFVFPTLEKDRSEYMTMKLYISGADAGIFSTEKGDGDNSAWHVVEVSLTDHNTINDETGEYDLPLVFEPNCSYMLRMVFTKDGIVTFSPEVYPWFDGETDGWEEGEGYEEQMIGNTMLFDNLIWSDRNLGAEDYFPENKERFEKCTGFFYQFDRNIPYFPMRNENGVMVNHVAEQAVVYPMVADPKARMQAPRNGGSGYVYLPDDIDPSVPSGLAWNYNSGYSAPKRLWDNVETQPTPPGWRLPTQQELFGILPSTTQAGNITFLRNVGHYGDFSGADNGGGDFYDDEDVETIYVRVPKDRDYPNYPADDKYSAVNVPQPDGDPYKGYSSEYLISRAYEDEVGRPAKELCSPGNGGRTIWGTIYGIKKVGTNDAYRMRWHIENADEGKSNCYVLVIERYQADAGDRLSRDPNDVHYYRKYDWTRPVAMLYLPVTGIIGDSGWSSRQGKLGNFGTEVVFATSEVDGGNQKTFRIKVTGSNRKNQFICPTVDRKAVGAQVRMVRESTYQPDRD